MYTSQLLVARQCRQRHITPQHLVWQDSSEHQADDGQLR
jgi:hypothetical protein